MLNNEVLQNPQAFKEIAPEIGNLAIEYFCKEVGDQLFNIRGLNFLTPLEKKA